jgi:hypothetical protein
LLLGFQHFALLETHFFLNHDAFKLNLVDPLFLSQFDAHA